MSWARLDAEAPQIAAAGRRLLYRDGIGQGLLATVRDGEPPRIHPIYVDIREGRLLAFITASDKLADLDADGRYALHTHVDPTAPSEFSVRGRARRIEGPLRAAVAADWYFVPGKGYGLFELEVEWALYGDRPTADDWPPVYSSWTYGAPEG